VDRDYNFLSQIERGIEAAGREREERGIDLHKKRQQLQQAGEGKKRRAKKNRRRKDPRANAKNGAVKEVDGGEQVKANVTEDLNGEEKAEEDSDIELEQDDELGPEVLSSKGRDTLPIQKPEDSDSEDDLENDRGPEVTSSKESHSPTEAILKDFDAEDGGEPDDASDLPTDNVKLLQAESEAHTSVSEDVQSGESGHIAISSEALQPGRLQDDSLPETTAVSTTDG
jgi:hypothetical protein